MRIALWIPVFFLATDSLASCGGGREDHDQHAPRTVETTIESYFVAEPIVAEQSFGQTTPAPAPPRTATVKTARSKGAIAGAKERPRPAEEAAEMQERASDAPAIAAPAPLVFLRPPLRVKREQAPAPVPPTERFTPAMNLSLVVGGIGAGVGTAAASGDGSPGERAFAATSLGIGLVGLTTAWILYATGAGVKDVNVMTRAGSLGFGGQF